VEQVLVVEVRPLDLARHQRRQLAAQLVRQLGPARLGREPRRIAHGALPGAHVGPARREPRDEQRADEHREQAGGVQRARQLPSLHA
jgi:hypothetical protein